MELHKIVRRSGLVLSLLLLLAPPARAVIRITEIMYHPREGGQMLEYIEILNETPDPMDITGYYFSEGVSFTFTERTFLEPGEYLVVCANADAIRAAYGIENAVGNWDAATALDNAGERVTLCNPGGVAEASVRYNDRGRWPSGADGTGHSLELRHIYSELDNPESWALSGVLGGSPGRPNDTQTGHLPVVINEALCLPSSAGRWVELYNASDADIDLSFHVISTDRLAAAGGRIPQGTIVPARRWVSFLDTALGLDFSPTASATDPAVLRTFIALWSPPGDRVIDARIFEPQEDSSEARIPDGGLRFTSAADPTRDAANAITVNGDVILNEILYRPIDRGTRGEFVELYNRGTEPVDMTGWAFTDGIRFAIPAGTTLLPDRYLVVARDPEHIRAVHGLPASQVIGPETDEARDSFGVLADGGERITLSDERGNTVDTVPYHDGGEWPQWADGGGSSMELIDPTHDNSQPQAWDSSDDAAKSVAKKYTYTGMYTGGETEFHLVVPGGGIAVVDDLKMVTQEIGVEVTQTFVAFDDTWRYVKGTQEPSDPIEGWRALDFDDSSWPEGPAIIGFGDGDEGTLLEDMRDTYTSFYVRKRFTVDDPSSIESLIFEIEYDDGYIAYLNGVEIALGNMDSAQRTYDATATRSREKVQERIDLTERKDELLAAGENVLAVQVHNSSIRSSDARFLARLVDGRFVITEGRNMFVDGAFESEAYAPNWTIEGTHVRSGRTETEPLSGSGSLKIVSTGGGDNKVNRIETSNRGFATSLDTRAEYSVSFLARWIVGSPTLLTHGANTTSGSPSYASSTRLEVPENLGTPGAINSVTLRQIERTGSSNLGPVIWDVMHDPATPASGEAVTVRARAFDPDGVAALVLLYSLNTPRPPGASLLELPMSGPDADGFYSVQVPGQSTRTRVVYYLTATDGAGNAGRFPLDRNRRTHPFLLDPESPSVNDDLYAIYRHDTPYRGRAHSYRVWVHQATEQDLSTRTLLSNDYADGTFIFQDQDVYYNTKVRFSGSPWARQRWTESYRIRMPKDHPFHGEIESFNLEDHQGAGARDGRERISHYMLRWFNHGSHRMPYSLQWLVQYQINDRVNEIREHIQTPNRQFISRWFPGDDDGDFFEMDDRFVINDAGTRQDSNDGRLLFPPYGSPLNGEDKEEYRYYFNPRLNRELDDYSELIRLAKLLTTSATPNEEFDARVFDEINVEEFCFNWAIRLNTDDWDTWGANRGKNCYLYRGRSEGRWYNIPWDLELTYGNTGAFMPPPVSAASNPVYAPGGKFPEVTRFLNRPAIKRIYYGVMNDMVNLQFYSEFLTPWLQRIARVGVQSTNVGSRNGWIDQRRGQLITRVRGVTSQAVDFAIQGGEAGIVANSSPVSIGGTAPVEVRMIIPLVDGGMAEGWKVDYLDPRSIVTWTATGPLPVGSHRIELLAFDGQDEILASAAAQVTVLTVTAPVIESIEPETAGRGDRIAIVGSNFQAGLKVLFGDVEAAGVTFDPDVDPSRIEVTVPSSVAPGTIEVRVSNPNGESSAPATLEIEDRRESFLRGDVDLSGTINLTDAVATLDFLFKRGATPGCLDAADSNDDGRVDVTDPIQILQFLFAGRAGFSPPYPIVGVDPTDDDGLSCETGLP